MEGTRQTLHKQISAVDTEKQRLVSAISAGGDIPALVEALRASNERKDSLSQRTGRVNGQQHSDADYDQLEKDLQAHFEASWKTILTRQVGPTRQILRKLFNGDRLPFIPMRTKVDLATNSRDCLDRAAADGSCKGPGVPNGI